MLILSPSDIMWSEGAWTVWMLFHCIDDCMSDRPDTQETVLLEALVRHIQSRKEMTPTDIQGRPMIVKL